VNLLVQEAMAALEGERAAALQRLRDVRNQQGKGILTRLLSEQRFTLTLPQHHKTLPIPEFKEYDKILTP
jgi:hypothetical protein